MPYYTEDPKRDHSFDNHIHSGLLLGFKIQWPLMLGDFAPFGAALRYNGLWEEKVGESPDSEPNAASLHYRPK